MADIIDNLKLKYKSGTVLTKLIFINVLVFAALKVIDVIFILFNIHSLDLITLLCVPSNLQLLTQRFWTPVAYMFVL
jgi:hypothetical protein